MFLPPVPFCRVTLKAKKPQNEGYLAYPKELETLGDLIRKRRLELKLTAKELGKILDVDPDTIYGWEYHKCAPNPRRLSEIIKFLGEDPQVLMRKFYGAVIRAYRMSHGLSQHKLALKLGVSRTAIQQWESNTRYPSEKYIERLTFILSNTSQKIPKITNVG
jgi:transcriptional regulator with XRE-family HTH domain